MWKRSADCLHTSAQKLQFPSEFQGNFRRDFGISRFAFYQISQLSLGSLIGIIDNSSEKSFSGKI